MNKVVVYMIRIQPVLGLCLLIAGCAANKGALRANGSDAASKPLERTALSSGHPMIGTWRVEMAKSLLRPPAGYVGECVEEYSLKADGTKSSRSGEERNESEFMITPGTRGPYWYKWTDKITANNGKPDCSGSHTTVGHTVSTYVIIHPTGERFALCEKEDLSTCYVELFRQSR